MRGRRVTDAELDTIGAEPQIGEVWWCRGESLGFADGGKVRPVLVIGFSSALARVIPLTTRKPAQNAVAVSHRAGTSWLTESENLMPADELLSGLGAWKGFAAWRALH
jgi:hypothetical protein